MCSLEADAPDERVRHRVVTRFVRVLQKMLVHDFAIHSGRQGWLMRLRGMVEAAEFVQLLVERVLAHYEKNPRLQDDDGHVLRNLSAMIALVDELFGERLTADLCVRLVDFINVLASQNTSEMRTRMKSVGLFNERDELLLRLLRLPMDSAARFAALSQLSLDVIALDAKFRSSNALEHVLLCLHDEQASFALRVLLADIVRNQLGAHVGLRKEITRIVAEPDVCERLLADVESDKHLDDSPESRLGPFVQWYFDAAQDAVRARVLERLHKLVAPAQTSLKRAQERLQTRKMKRLHARLDKLGKAAAASERAVQDALERSETITARACRAYAMQQQSAVEERLRRAETGELAFHSVMDELERTNWRALTPPCVAYDVQESEEASRSVSSESCCKCIRLANATTLESSWELLCHIRIDHRHNPQMAVSETNSVATMPEGAADETGG